MIRNRIEDVNQIKLKLVEIRPKPMDINYAMELLGCQKKHALNIFREISDSDNYKLVIGTSRSNRTKLYDLSDKDVQIEKPYFKSIKDWFKKHPKLTVVNFASKICINGDNSNNLNNYHIIKILKDFAESNSDYEFIDFFEKKINKFDNTPLEKQTFDDDSNSYLVRKSYYKKILSMKDIGVDVI